jgi:hypothetical protein
VDVVASSQAPGFFHILEVGLLWVLP